VTCETDGGVRVFRPVATPLADGQGTPPAWLYLARDVTAQISRENVLEEHLRRVQTANAGITSVSQALNCGIASILGRVEEASDGARQQQLRVEAVQRSMHQMTAAACDVSDNARAASGQAAQARESASLGERAVSRATGAIDAVRAQAQRLRENMAALQRRTKDIGGILTVISDIADQTNLLALNAAIEAARAGTEGRGFAVVADEVRKLAEKTMRATGEVNQAIAAIQEEARRSQGVSETAAEAVDEAAALSARAGAVLADIVALVDRTAGQAHNIAAAARQQSKASEDIDLALRDVTSVSANTVEGMSTASEALENLSAVAGRLRRAVTAVEAPDDACACRVGQGEPAPARGQLV
jgi:methyl-accepting chemotaxis protein